MRRPLRAGRLTLVLGLLSAAEVPLRAQDRGISAAMLVGGGVRSSAAGFGTVLGELALSTHRWEVRGGVGYQRWLDPQCPNPAPPGGCDNGGSAVLDLMGGLRAGAWSLGVGPGLVSNHSVPFLGGLIGWQVASSRGVAFRAEARARALFRDGTHAELLLLVGLAFPRL